MTVKHEILMAFKASQNVIKEKELALTRAIEIENWRLAADLESHVVGMKRIYDIFELSIDYKEKEVKKDD